MSRWEEQFQSHPIHTTLNEVRDFMEVEPKDISDEEQIEKRRLLKIINAYEDVFSQLDPEMVPYHLLDGINTNLRHENIWSQLKAYKNQPNAKSLRRVNNEITNQLGHLSQLLAIAKKSFSEKPLRGVEKSLDDFCAALSAKKAALQGELEKIATEFSEQSQKLSDLSSKISTQKTETDQLIAGWQKQFSDAQDIRSKDFIKDQKDRKAEYETWRDKIKTETDGKVQGLVDKAKATLEAAQKSFDDEISGYLDTASTKHQSILDLYEIVAGDSVGAGYLKNANDEKSQANFWRWASIVFIALTATWTALSYWWSPTALISDGSSKILWAQILKAFSVTAVLLFGAAYSAKQSNIHRQNEKRTRWFALEVKAIDPFISSLDDPDRKALKKLLSERLFGQKDSHNDDHKVIDEHAFSVLVKGIVDILKVR